MEVNAIFSKWVGRTIEGVIKADDETMLRQELEEYVITNEIQERLENFLDLYNDPVGVNGAWLSGFFGSGKSHLLKILALILENREIDGVKALDLFLPKLDSINNTLLKTSIERAAKLPSKSILFNIDQRADVINKTDTDALVSVFFRVFDEMCGYYGKHSYVAQFERDLDERGLYNKFQEAYERITGQNWITDREATILMSHHVNHAYAEISGQPTDQVRNILAEYRKTHRLSIEDFANEVKKFIDRQGPTFRLNFFVDEVGQFIADHVKLMTNLQTIAESLATICEGRSWIVVTSQSDMETVVGELTTQSGDFSKIRDRFKVELHLTSINVAEVIKKRLLTKNKEGEKALEMLYGENVNNFGTLFSFTGGSRSFAPYRNRTEFIETYPFVPYQFELFQLSIQKLSSNNVFEGRHRSTGERSMLAVFQDVTKSLSHVPVGRLATFDQMFDGIKNSIKPQAQFPVIAAERQLGQSEHAFDLKLLKILFLVKYVGEFKPTINNLSILILPQFDANIVELRAKVGEALNYLEQQTYIRRHGEIFEYLTDEEKDIEQEIKETEIAILEIKKELSSLLFDSILQSKKMRCDATGHDYPFGQKLDDMLFGREQELTIHVISPFNEWIDDHETLRARSSGLSEMLIIMPPEHRLIQELRIYKQTEKYNNLNFSKDLPDSVRIILQEKEIRNHERYESLKRMLGTLLSEATIYVGNTEVDSKSDDPKTRVNKAFQHLISSTYPNLRMIYGTAYTVRMLPQIITDSKNVSIFEESSLPEPEQEVLSIINTRKESGQRTPVKDVIDCFKRKPYGWYDEAVLIILIKLYSRGKIEAIRDGVMLDKELLLQALTDSTSHGNVVLEPQIEFPASQIRRAKQFSENYFHEPSSATEAKAIGKEMLSRYFELNTKLAQAVELKESFPFTPVLSDIVDRIESVLQKPYHWLMNELIEDQEQWLQEKDAIIDPILRFVDGPMGEIFLKAKTYLALNKNNFSYLDDRHDDQLIQSLLDDPECYRKDTMKLVKEKLEGLSSKVSEKISEERRAAIAVLDRMRADLEANADYQALEYSFKDDVLEQFTISVNRINEEISIPAIREQSRQFKDNRIISIRNQIIEWTSPTSEKEGVRPLQLLQYISSKKITISYQKSTIEDEQDLEKYIKALKEAWMDVMTDGKKIQLS